MMSSPLLKIIKIPNLDTIVLRQEGRKFFVTTKNSFIIDMSGFLLIIRFIVLNNMVDVNILERILDEYKSKQN